MVSRSMKHRLAFTILGLANNFSYIVMLSAAEDLIIRSTNSYEKDTGELRFCNELSTSAILLADIAPALILQFSYPFLLVDVRPIFKVLATVLLAAGGFIITGLSDNIILVFVGVVSASISSGLGESTILSDTSVYGFDSLAGWSIGTGAAGICGSSAYAILTIFFPEKTIMLIMTVVPIGMLLTYIFLIKKDRENLTANQQKDLSSLERIPNENQDKITFSRRLERQSKIDLDGLEQSRDTHNEEFGFIQRIRYLPKLANYFFPVVIVFFGGYFINQGLVEFIYYDNVTYLNKASQYRWLQVSYQLGSLLSRSSIALFRVPYIWTMAFLQMVNVGVILCHVAKIYQLPSFYFVAGLVLYEGLLTGFSYSNTYYRMGKEVEPSKQHFSISAVVISDAFGISIAALAALPLHETLCNLYD